MPEQFRISRVTLCVRNLDEMVNFYHQIVGLRVLRRDASSAALSAPDTSDPLLMLIGDLNAQIHRPSMTGLFHIAFRFPSCTDLAHAVLRLVKHNWSVEGVSNHLVSEAIYLSDPEGNGIELYTDRPRAKWQWHGGQVMMATEALDLEAFLLSADCEGMSSGVPPDTDIGHLHLQVADLPLAERFFSGFLGSILPRKHTRVHSSSRLAATITISGQTYGAGERKRRQKAPWDWLLIGWSWADLKI